MEVVKFLGNQSPENAVILNVQSRLHVLKGALLSYGAHILRSTSLGFSTVDVALGLHPDLTSHSANSRVLWKGWKSSFSILVDNEMVWSWAMSRCWWTEIPRKEWRVQHSVKRTLVMKWKHALADKCQDWNIETKLNSGETQRDLSLWGLSLWDRSSPTFLGNFLPTTSTRNRKSFHKY